MTWSLNNTAFTACLDIDRYMNKSSPVFGADNIGARTKYFFKSWKASSHSLVHWKPFHFFNS